MVYRILERLIADRKTDLNELWAYISMSKSGYYTMMRDRTMKLDVLEKIAEFYQVSPAYFFEHESNKADTGKGLQAKLTQCFEEQKELYKQKDSLYRSKEELYERLVASEAEKVQILKQTKELQGKPLKQ